MSDPIPSFFDTPEKIAQLRACAKSWEGTPFFANSEARGAAGGVDCVRLLRAIYRECGAVGDLVIPVQTMDHGQHHGHSLLIEAFESWPALATRFARLPDCSPANLRAGDALCFTAGRVPHHGGVSLDGDLFVHALKPEGVYAMQLSAKVRGWKIIGQLAAAFRPLPLP